MQGKENLIRKRITYYVMNQIEKILISMSKFLNRFIYFLCTLFYFSVFPYHKYFDKLLQSKNTQCYVGISLRWA